MRRLQIIAALCLAVVAALIATVSAAAAPSDPFQFKYSFDGSGLPSGLTEPVALAVNNQTGNVLVSDRAKGTIDQFDSEGNPVNFPATGSPQISLAQGGGGYIVVDNSGGPTQGNIYVFGTEYPNYLYTYYADGSPIPGGMGGGVHSAYLEGLAPGFPCGAGGVGPDGELWLAFNSYDESGPFLSELTPEGVPTGKEVHLSMPEGKRFSGSCSVVFDGAGNAYAPREGGDSFEEIPLTKFDAENNFSVLGDTGLVLNINRVNELAVDPATNDLYADETTRVLQSSYSDPLVKRPPTEAIAGISASHGIAFDPTGQYLYLSEGSRIDVFHREPASAPYGLGQLRIDEIRSQGAQLHGQLSAGGAVTSYHLEYGTDTSYGSSTTEVQAPLSYFPVKFDAKLEGLQPGMTYHVRLVTINSAGVTYGPDREFKTYPTPPGGPDPCANALARKQTGSRALPDCRAFELVSASDTGGYDVESYLAPGQTPFPGFPLADGRVLYATHSGAVPGPWNATNKGPDPYLATRGAEGWSTDYVGLPSDINPKAGGFSSVLGEADAGLSTFAFAGAGLCSPCFSSGLETGIPVRLPGGELVQGMAGSLNPGVPSARPEGKVARYFSADGTHLVFASKYAFEPGANDNGSDLTVYDRNLKAGTTEIASTTPGGTTMTGAGISELDVSADGSRVAFAQKVSTDSAGNEYVRPYLHLAGSPDSVDLAPGTTSGVLFAGMSADGSRVFFTTADKLLGADTDTSADLYEADVDSAGSLDLSLVTTGNSDACSPVSNSARSHWNSVGAAANCNAVAIGGGGGVASAGGSVYFLSPEQLDGSEGTLNQPNLYLAQPGQGPSFVATLEPSNPLVLDSVGAAARRETGDFELTADGGYAVFVSNLPLTGVGNFGFRSVFRYDAGGAQLSCASCDTTGTTDSSLAADALLAPSGLSLIDDGRVFFTTRAALVLNDANGRKDVYEWSGDGPQLISAGTGPFDSALLSVSADGTDAFFFTHDTLATTEDANGTLMKIYDARVGGGFFKLPADVPCAASDECHGPGTVTPPPPDIRSSGKTTVGNVVTCAKNRVKRRGKCVKRQSHAKKAHAKKRDANSNGKRGGRHA